MKTLQKSNSKLTLIHGITFALVASFVTPALAENRYEGSLGIERQKVEKPQGGQVERRPDRRIEQPRAEHPRERQSERRHEKREEKRDAWRDERRADRQYDRHMDRVERRIYRPPVWRGDIRYFDRHDMPRWRGGAWRHTRHEGRLGWWWVVGGGSWYFYSQPVYPYPDPYIPSGYFYSQPEYSYPAPYIPPVVVIESEPVESTPEIIVAPAAASQYWYFCVSTQGYYPYSASCPEGWVAVPATPASAQ